MDGTKGLAGVAGSLLTTVEGFCIKLVDGGEPLLEMLCLLLKVVNVLPVLIDTGPLLALLAASWKTTHRKCLERLQASQKTSAVNRQV